MPTFKMFGASAMPRLAVLPALLDRTRAPAPQKLACDCQCGMDLTNGSAAREAAMADTIPNGRYMAGLETIRASPELAAIDEGNALEQQGRIAKALAL